MTTCVWSYKHSELGADRLSTDGLTVNKVFRFKNGSCLTGAGYIDDVAEVAYWISKGCKESSKPDLSGRDTDKDSDFLLIDSAGVAYWLTCPFLRRVEVTDTFFTLGSGAQYAMGALEAGATPSEALAIAARHDQATGHDFDIVTFKRK